MVPAKNRPSRVRWLGQTYPFILSAGVINRNYKVCQGKINGRSPERDARPETTLREVEPAVMKVLCRRGQVVSETPFGGCRLDSLTNTPVRVNKTLRASASAEYFLFHKFSNESASVKC